MADSDQTTSSETSITLQFKWTDELTTKLIYWRAANDSLFTGKRNAAMKGFEAFVKESGLQGVLSPAWVKKKWENLKQKYKDLKCPQSGISTESGEATAASWKWYDAMDGAIGGRPSITPPVLIASASPDAAVSSPPSNTESRQEKDTPVRKRSRADVLEYLREVEERQEEREREAQEREARQLREAEEREERREMEKLEREERREREKIEREERREREKIEREESREREKIEREERREREPKEREERFLKLMELLIRNK